MQIKPPDTTLHLLAWLLSKRQEITSIGKDEEKRQHLCTVGGDINQYGHSRKQYEGFSKN